MMQYPSKRALLGAAAFFTLLGLGGCAADQQACYESVEHHEYGQTLKAVPCEAGATAGAGTS